MSRTGKRTGASAEAVEETGVVHRLGRYIVREANATPAAASSSPTSSARDPVTRSRRNAHMRDFTNFVQQNATILISLASLLISLCAVTFTAYQVFATRKHNRVSRLGHILRRLLNGIQSLKITKQSRQIFKIERLDDIDHEVR